MICLPFAYVGYLAFQKREEYNSKCSILIDMIVFALFLFTSLFNDVRKVSFSSGIYGNYCFMYLSGISGSFLLIELAKRLALLRSGWMLRMIKLWGKHSILIMGLDYLTRACIKAVLANVCVGVLQMLLIMICQFFILSIALYVWEMITLISIKNHNNML